MLPAALETLSPSASYFSLRAAKKSNQKKAAFPDQGSLGLRVNRPFSDSPSWLD
jgi:hypothetical protein